MNILDNEQIDKKNSKLEPCILALDPASKKTGYAIYKRHKIVKHGTWLLDKKDPITDLYIYIRDTINEYGVTHVVCENYFIDPTKTPATWHKLADVHGAIHIACRLNGLKAPSKIEPIEAKERMGIRLRNFNRTPTSREYQKKTMIKHVQQYGYTLESDEADDEADAIGICLSYIWKNKLLIRFPNE